MPQQDRTDGQMDTTYLPPVQLHWKCVRCTCLCTPAWTAVSHRHHFQAPLPSVVGPTGSASSAHVNGVSYCCMISGPAYGKERPDHHCALHRSDAFQDEHWVKARYLCKLKPYPPHKRPQYGSWECLMGQRSISPETTMCTRAGTTNKQVDRVRKRS